MTHLSLLYMLEDLLKIGSALYLPSQLAENASCRIQRPATAEQSSQGVASLRQAQLLAGCTNDDLGGSFTQLWVPGEGKQLQPEGFQ